MKYLNCPFCPAQAYPTTKQLGLREYQCPARHKFLIQEDNELREVDSVVGNRSQCVE